MDVDLFVKKVDAADTDLQTARAHTEDPEGSGCEGLVRARLFRLVEALFGGAVVTPGGRQQWLLVSLLLVRPDEVVSIERMVPSS